MTKQQAIADQIATILDTFDFEHVERIMHSTGWCWGSDIEPPSQRELRLAARDILRSAAEIGGYGSSGGFTAHCRKYKHKGKRYLGLYLYFGVDNCGEIEPTPYTKAGDA